MKFVQRSNTRSDQRKLIDFRQQKRLLNELNRILRKEHVRGVLSAHEQLMEELTQGAARNPYFEMYEYEANLDSKPANEAREHELNEARGMPVRVVGIRKAEDEPLGITVRQEDDGRVVVARVMTGGVVDVQGLLHVNDQILEMNGQPVQSAAQLQQMMRRCNDSLIQFRIVPSFDEPIAQLSCHVKSLFNYDPSVDTLLPCKELGLPFVQGDILEIMNQEDANWWQARKVDTLALSEAGAGNTLTMGARVMFTGQQIGLIPSQELEEKRWAFVRPEFDYASKTSICGTQVIKKKKKSFYSINANTAFDNAELIFYEEVCRLNHFQRKCIVLVGASGVGRKAMKQRLIQSDPDKYSSVTPSTSRPPRDGEQHGKVYFFVNRPQIEQDISDNKYLEHGEYQGHLYGTKLSSIRTVINEGKIAVIDCNPQSLKLLRTPEYMPFIVFLGAPPIDQLRYLHDWGRQNNVSRMNCTLDRAVGRSSRRAKTMQSLASFYEDEDLQQTIDESNRIQRNYERYFDLSLTNFNFERTFQTLHESLCRLETEAQWVPISWILHGE